MDGYRFENPMDIKLLVLFTVKHTGRAVSNVEIADVLYGSANYFLVARAAAELAQTGLLTCPEPSLYQMTEQGEKALSGFGAEIPFSVRENILRTMESTRRAEQRKVTVKTEIETVNEISYLAHMKMLQGDTVLISLSLNVGSRRTAGELLKRFSRDPEGFYEKMLTELLKEKAE